MKEYLMNHGESTVIETVNAAKPNFKKEELLNAMKYRYATKRFSEKTIPPEDFEGKYLSFRTKRFVKK